jgi:hypothetical protein
MPRAPGWWPDWKPFLNRRETFLRYRMRPVPVVFLRFAFSDQLSDVPLSISLRRQVPRSSRTGLCVSQPLNPWV